MLIKLRPPPPPPFLRERSVADFSRSTVKPMTQTICTSATEGRTHKNVCTFMIDQLSKRQTVGFLVGVVPLCEPVCWNACQGEDSFATCKRAECAAADCLSFLINECPPAMSNAFRNQHNARCSLVPPLPPPPPTPPPLQSPPAKPPTPPHKPPSAPPPPIVPAYELRFSNSEASWQQPCLPVSLNDCKAIVEDFARQTGTPNTLRVWRPMCNGREHDLTAL